MPDNEKVIFGAEFESQGVVRGAEAAINALNKLKDTQLEVKNQSVEWKQDLKQVEKNLGDVTKQMEGLNKSSTTYRKELEALNKQQSSLIGEQKALQLALDNNAKKYALVSTAIKDQSKAVTQLKKDNEVTGQAIGKFTSVNQLAAQGINNLRGQVISAGTALVSGFAGGIIAAAIPAVIALVEEVFKADSALDTLKRNKAVLSGVFDEASKAAGRSVAQLEVFRVKLNDTTLTEKERVKVAKEYNKVADDQNKLDLKQIDNLQLINEKIDAQNKLIIARAVSVAALNKLGTFATAVVDTQLTLSNELQRWGIKEEDIQKRMRTAYENTNSARAKGLESLDNYNKAQVRGTVLSLEESRKQNTIVGANIYELNRLQRARDAASKQLQDMVKLLNPLITPDGLTTTGGPKGREIENVFLQKLAELRARMASAAANAFQSDGLIKGKFAAQLDKEFFEIGKLLKEKKLTAPQANILKGLLEQINGIDLAKGLEDFHKKQRDAIQKVNDAILAASIEDAQKRTANIRDEFEREQETIEQSFAATETGLKKRMRDLLQVVENDVNTGLISGTTGQAKSLIITAVFGDLLTQAGQEKINRQLDLAFRTFQRTLKDAQIRFQEGLVENEETTTERITNATKAFVQGQTTFKQYQEELTKIAKEGAKARRVVQILEYQEQLRLLDTQIAGTTDAAQKKQLEEQRRGVRTTLAQLGREAAEGQGQEDEDATKKKVENIIAYANAINGLLQAVLGFWAQVNRAEEEALNRSIALQERRVSNARDIAEKGNAEYLEQEQKRLDELERKREENARKQLAINNALTLSNATVAAITAIAQAVATGSPFAALAAVGAVVGAIAAAYAFVSSLEPQSANFYEGTEYVDGAGRPRGKDTVPAKLTIGERVVTADRNAQYWDTLHAVHNGLIPANVLNSFVNTYPNIAIPGLDYGRLNAATNGKMGADSAEVARKIDQTNETLGNVIEAIASIGVNVKMDEDGFAASVSRFNAQKLLRKRS